MCHIFKRGVQLSLPMKTHISSGTFQPGLNTYFPSFIIDFNPSDMKHGAKTAVKFNILRVVMLWSSQSEDFMT